MNASAPNYLWRKHATPEWLRAHHPALNKATNGAHSVIERPGRPRLAVECFCTREQQARDLAAAFGGTMVRLPADWEARYLAAAKTKPLRIGTRLVVCSDPQPSSKTPTLIIPAGAAFGTGEHATTAMSLRLLERVTRRMTTGWRMLDAGTGSGILALAARRFGANDVLAVDNDPRAITTARENARSNHIRGIAFVVGDIHEEVRGRFDVIAANLYSELLAAVLPRFRRSLRVRGSLILSGVLRRQEHELQDALRANDFRILETRRRGKWIALLAGGAKF